MYLDDGLTPSEISDLLKWDWSEGEQSDTLTKSVADQSDTLTKCSSCVGSLCPIREVDCSSAVASRLGVDRISKVDVKILGKQKEKGVTKYATQIAGPYGSYILNRRYTEFEELYREIFGEEAGAREAKDVMMPPKSFWKKAFSREFHRERERRLGEVAAAALVAAADADLHDCPPGLRRFLGWDEGTDLQSLTFSQVEQDARSAADTITDSELTSTKASSCGSPRLKNKVDSLPFEGGGLNLGGRSRKFNAYLAHMPNSPRRESSTEKRGKLRQAGKHTSDVMREVKPPRLLFSERGPAPEGCPYQRRCFSATNLHEVKENAMWKVKAYSLPDPCSCLFSRALSTAEESCTNQVANLEAKSHRICGRLVGCFDTAADDAAADASSFPVAAHWHDAEQMPSNQNERSTAKALCSDDVNDKRGRYVLKCPP